MKGILVIGHGSRSERAREEFGAVVSMIEKKVSCPVMGAHMELHSPDIPTAIENMLIEFPNVTEVNAVPLFLFEGIHIREDIPEILAEMKEKHPNITFKFGRPIGAEEMLADIIVKRAEEL